MWPSYINPKLFLKFTSLVQPPEKSPLILQKQIQSEGLKALGRNEAFGDAIMPLCPLAS